jgi:hypothetical protein
MQSTSGGGRARACGGRLQRRGPSLPCDTSAIELSSSTIAVAVGDYLKNI